MKLKQLFRTVMSATLLCGVVAAVSSCKDDDTTVPLPSSGTIMGTVYDSAEDMLGGVTVEISGGDLATPIVLTTASDGTYSQPDLTIANYTVKFSKTNYQTKFVNVTSIQFLGSGLVTVNATLADAPYHISGTVTDEDDATMSGVRVKVRNAEEEEVGDVTTDADGVYTVDVASMAEYWLVFSKEGYDDAEESVLADSFDAETRTAELDVTMLLAAPEFYQISGIVYNEVEEPFEGVSVVVTDASDVEVGTATTAEDGTYVIDVDGAADYKAVFTMEGYKKNTINILATEFQRGIADIDANMVLIGDPLRGQTAAELAAAPKLLYNWYLGGNGGFTHPIGDWSTNGTLYAAMPVYGAYSCVANGLSINISSPAPEATDTEVFNSYAYFSKKIINGNHILSIKARTNSDSGQAIWGVQVVDLSAEEPVAVKITSAAAETAGYISTTGQNSTDYSFDLSAYKNKEVIIAIGQYYHSTLGASQQFVLRSVRFGGAAYTGGDWPTDGTAITGLTGWRISQEDVTSTMVQTNNVFTAITGSAYNNGNFWTGYNVCRNQIADGTSAAAYHILHGWTLVPVSKDAEPMQTEGMIIKTANSTASEIPHAYIYAKFNITPANNLLTIWARSFNDTPALTRNKVTVIKEDFTYAHLGAPATYEYPSTGTNKRTNPAAGTDGSWTWCYNLGSGITTMAKFNFDLSAYNGQTVVIAIGVFPYAAAGSSVNENKICFRRIEFSAKP